MSSEINVIKRSGKSEQLDINKLHVMVEAACEGIAGVSVSLVEMNSQIQFFDGITTDQIQQILVNSASNLIDLDHPNYQFVAARLMLFALRKQVYGKMHELVSVREQVQRGVDAGVYDTEILDLYTEEEFAEFDNIIDHDRDYIFTFAGLRQVLDKYLVQDRTSGEMYESKTSSGKKCVFDCTESRTIWSSSSRRASSGTEKLVVLAETRETDPAAHDKIRSDINGRAGDLIGIGQFARA